MLNPVFLCSLNLMIETMTIQGNLVIIITITRSSPAYLTKMQNTFKSCLLLTCKKSLPNKQ